MKFNKWTLGLAALGVVSLASAARADEQGNFVQTALSGTTISGNVDVSAQWNPGTGNDWVAPVSFQDSDKADGINLNVVQLTLDKPLDESEWASGYHVDLWFGPDANALGTQSRNSDHWTGDGYYYYGGMQSPDFAIRQAYVALRTPVGNGIDWKIGVFDTIIGYESLSSVNNPNYTRSYGFTIEPTTHTGVLASYRFNDIVSASVGMANTVGPIINERAFLEGPGVSKAESYKTYMGSVALTAPQDWGWMAGSTLYAGVVNGFAEAADDNITSYYVGTTVATPVAGLKAGAALDYLSIHNYHSMFVGGMGRDHAFAAAIYGSYQATEKMSFHLRGDYLDDNIGIFDYPEQFYSVTATVQYDLWENVLSRLEFRWDHAAHTKWFGGNPNSSTESFKENAFMLAANVIYKF